jgi:AcrR family transcriptional regulator
MDVDTAPAGPGLRERKKQLTRLALQRAAFELFAERGYDETTVEEIAEAAQVSRASFFRYFASKDDVLTSDDDVRREAVMAAFAARDDSEPVLDALRHAVLSYVDGMDEAAVLRSQTYTQVILSSRVLLGRAYEIRIRWLRELEVELRRRLEGKADADLVAALLAAITLSVLETCLRRASMRPGDDFNELVDRGFALLDQDSADR